MIVHSLHPGKPVQLLRTSSEQMRRAADLLDQIAVETAIAGAGDPPAGEASAAPDRSEAEQTIRLAQRSFAASLRLAQFQEAPEEA